MLSAVLLHSLVCSAAAYAFWFFGIAKDKIGETAGFSGFMPLSSVALSIVVLGEKISHSNIIGMVLVIIGIYMIVLKKRVLEYETYNN